MTITQMAEGQLNDISRFYDLIKSDSGIIECFFINPEGKNITRYCENKEKFINDVASFNLKGFTCYAGIQPRRRNLLSSNKASTKEDIVALRFLYLDLDPVKPEDKEKENVQIKKRNIALSRLYTFKEY